MKCQRAFLIVNIVYLFSHQNIKYLVEMISYGVNQPGKRFTISFQTTLLSCNINTGICEWAINDGNKETTSEQATWWSWWGWWWEMFFLSHFNSKLILRVKLLSRLKDRIWWLISLSSLWKQVAICHFIVTVVRRGAFKLGSFYGNFYGSRFFHGANRTKSSVKQLAVKSRAEVWLIYTDGSRLWTMR